MNDLLITLGWLVPAATSASEYLAALIERSFGLQLQGKVAVLKSWLVAIAITTAAAAYDPELFGGIPSSTWWILGPVWGVVVAGLSNGLFQLDQVKTFLTVIRARKR